MYARAHTFTIDGLHALHVIVEVDVRRGLPAFAIVGLADTAVREARERIQAAILNSGFQFPALRITANLAPGDVRKAGPGLDLALACAVLAADGQLPRERLERLTLYGELALDGALRPCAGALAVAQATRRVGARGLVLAAAQAAEAQLVDGLQVFAVSNLRAAARVLSGGAGERPPPAPARPVPPAERQPDLGDVRGQHHAVRTLVIAAAGSHNLLLNGPPGTGKTMLAQRAPSILPPLTRAQAVEVTRIHGLAGGRRVQGLVERRPFRAPHHSVTAAGLVGGSGASVGEAVLAHHGVLFLDELAEFSRAALEALRQPLEDGRVAIARAGRSRVLPTRFMLLAATNPCPCGFAGDGERCSCSETALARHRMRLSGPLLDRIDLLASMGRGEGDGLAAAPLTTSAVALAQVLDARERQAARLAGEGVAVNGHMDAALLRRHVPLDERCEQMLVSARRGGLLSTRGEHRVLRVARTVADLDGSAVLRARDLAAALALRTDAALAGNRAA